MPETLTYESKMAEFLGLPAVEVNVKLSEKQFGVFDLALASALRANPFPDQRTAGLNIEYHKYDGSWSERIVVFKPGVSKETIQDVVTRMMANVKKEVDAAFRKSRR